MLSKLSLHCSMIQYTLALLDLKMIDVLAEWGHARSLGQTSLLIFHWVLSSNRSIPRRRVLLEDQYH